MLSAISPTRHSMPPSADERAASVSVPPPVNPDDSTTSTERPGSPSSLREAALLSLRAAKRRKPTVEVMLRPTPMAVPRPLVKESSIQLDYGQDDSSEVVSSKTVPPSSVQSTTAPSVDNRPSSGTPAPTVKNEDEDIDMREEGEISDEEGSPLSVVAEPVKPAPQIERTLPPRPAPAVTIPASTSTLPARPSPPSVTSRTPLPTAPSRPLVARVNVNDVSSASPSLSSSLSFDGLRFPFPLDANHVRPGLSLTQEQYDTAKDIVLDLLGWGVPPEYLVDCGLSREIVFYIFSELNLRLPNNLDTNGIIPFPPPLELLQNAQHQTPASPPLLERISSGKPENLVVMEQQRRRELLARKAAVQASRKRKGAPTDEGPVTKKALVPRDSVDDFLSSIEPAVSPSPISSLKGKEAVRDVRLTERPRAESPEAMEVDEIPGLGGRAYPPDALPLSAASSLASTRSVPLPDSSRASSESNGGAPVPLLTSARRKRPVAADFDVDPDSSAPTPTGAEAGMSLARSSSVVSVYGHPNPHVRRWMQSEQDMQSARGQQQERTVFSTLTAPRCVIDWNSDSEDEEDVEEALSLPRGSTSVQTTSGGRLTPPTPALTPSAASELEKRIAQMREEIRAKEELRLRKMATASSSGSGRATPTLAAGMGAKSGVHSNPHDAATPTAHPPPLRAQASFAISTPLPPQELIDSEMSSSNGGIALVGPTTADVVPDVQGLLTAESRHQQPARISPTHLAITANPF